MIAALSVDCANPVNWDHPLNVGRVFWALCLPGATDGALWRDLCSAPDMHYGNHGVLTGMGDVSYPGSANGWRGTNQPGGWGCLLFDGTAGRVIISSAMLNLENVSVAAWIFLPAAGTARYIIGFGITPPFPYYLRADVGGGVSFQASDATHSPLASTGTSLADGKWHRVLGTRSKGGTISIYIDGVLSTSTADTTTISTTSSLPLNIGSRNGALFYKGQLNDVTIWNRCLSASDARAECELSKQYYPGMINRLAPYARQPRGPSLSLIGCGA